MAFFMQFKNLFNFNRYPKRRNLSGNKASSVNTPMGMYPSSRASSPDFCADLDDERIE